MKGPSNKYGNTRGAHHNGVITRFIGYAWAKYFNKNKLKIHFDEHGKSMNFINEYDYAQHAMKFANTVDRKNNVSFIDRKGSTFKYSTKTNEFTIVKKDGTIITYFKPKTGYNYYLKQRRMYKK